MVKKDCEITSPTRSDKKVEYMFVRTSAIEVVPSVYSKVIFPDALSVSADTNMCKPKYGDSGTLTVCPAIIALSLLFPS